MFRWAIIFAVIALIASLLGFGGVAGLSKDFAIILLVIAVILAIIGFISRVMRRRDGTLFWCHVVGRALDRAQPFARAVWMFEDISHRRVVSTPLTVREREVAQHIVTGATSKQIARHLNISHRTVEAHRGRLMRKLGATSTGELVALLLGMP